MSKFLDMTFSPAADAALDEPTATATETSVTKKIRPPELTMRAPKKSYALFHFALLVYLFLFCSRLPELMPKFRVALAMTIIMLAGAVATGKGTAILRTRWGKIIAAFTVWTALCVPTSVWVAGSLDQLKAVVQSALLASFVIAFARTVPEVKHAMYSIGAAAGLVAVLSLLTFQASELHQGQRLGLINSPTLESPDFLSFYLLVGLPFLYLGATRGKAWMRVLYLALIPICLLAIGHAGSRMALVLFVAGMVIFMGSASNKERALVAMGTVVVAAAIVPLLPTSVMDRFATFFNSNPSAETTEAAASTHARLELLWRSLVVTAKNPLLGVGPGQFTVAEDQLARAEGRPRGLWYYTHNAYTQHSSEAGIPAAVLYIMALFVAYRGLSPIRKRGPTKEIRDMARAVQLSLWMIILAGFFLTIGFGGMPFVIMAMCISFKMAVAAEMRKLKAANLQAAAA